MLRFLARAVGTLLLAVALVYAVGDIARSVADDAVITTSLAGALEGLGLASAGGAWLAPVLALLGPFPAALVLFCAALLLVLLGRAPRRRAPWPQGS